MPLTLRRGTVTAVVERHEGLERLEVDGSACIAYPGLTGGVHVGDDVLVNVQARELGLGSGGFDVLYANLTRGLDLAPDDEAHVMKLPYTPLQHAVRHGEEDRPLAAGLEGRPVVCCTLHSQVVPAVAALAGRRVAYVQVAGGALPLALSDALRALRSRGAVEVALAAGPCVGGDIDAVNVHSALALAAGQGVDVVVCAVGPGIAGTGTALGHGAMGLADAAAAASALGGRVVLAPRISERDGRARHRGLSHHARAILELHGRSLRLPWPVGCPIPAPDAAEPVDADGWRAACAGLPLAHMGRGPDDDPWFFAAAFAAGRLAASLAP